MKQVVCAFLWLNSLCLVTACFAQKHSKHKPSVLVKTKQHAQPIAAPILPTTVNSVATLAQKYFFADSNFASSQIGIYLCNPATKTNLYSYQSDKYFIPASNMKLFTCYAALQNLGDSLVGLQIDEYPTSLLLHPTGDPTLLHPDFANHPVIDFLQTQTKKLQYQNKAWNENQLGMGWTWDDELNDYSAERSALPVYGNVAGLVGNHTIEPAFFAPYVSYRGSATLKRNRYANVFEANDLATSSLKIPFITNDSLAVNILATAIGKPIDVLKANKPLPAPNWSYRIYSQPTDSLLAKMLYRSDNLYAEQSLLMVSNQLIGTMNDAKVIDTLLKSTFAVLPQKIKWVDGCGLSRFNLVTPQTIVWVLNQMQQTYSWQRITNILPTGNQGTLRGYYTNYVGNIYAKTGSMGGVAALSGYLVTKQKKRVVFSVMVNNYIAGGTIIRRAIEKFLGAVIEGN